MTPKDAQIVNAGIAAAQALPGECALCGCTEFNACVRECVHGVLACWWVEPGLCSFCFWQLAEAEYNRVRFEEVSFDG